MLAEYEHQTLSVITIFWTTSFLVVCIDNVFVTSPFPVRFPPTVRVLWERRDAREIIRKVFRIEESISFILRYYTLLVAILRCRCCFLGLHSEGNLSTVRQMRQGLRCWVTIQSDQKTRIRAKRTRTITVEKETGEQELIEANPSMMMFPL